jgi:cytoskeletal protein CcmA (bactofilin family)
MWKKVEGEERPPAAPPVLPRQEPPPAKEPARIGASLFFKGDLQGDEDLVIEGRVEGRIAIKQGRVTVGEKGRVEADIDAASILVAGVVKGNLNGGDRVVLHQSGRVEGNIVAKSVILENGCRFKGSIDMEGDAAARAQSRPAATSAGAKPNGPESTARVGL